MISASCGASIKTGMIERAIGKKPPKKPKPEEIETVPDAWERFEKIIGKIVPPKHNTNGVNF